MTEPSLLELFIKPLSASGIAYFITGGVATIIYGEPRFTRDIDVVLSVRPSDAVRFLSLWPENSYYSPPLEAFEEESARHRHGHFNVIHIESGLVADCYVAGDDPLHAWAFERVLTLDVDGLSIRIAPVEYVIVRKLSYFTQSGSTRHLEDVVRICRIRGNEIDQRIMDAWIVELDVEAAWQKALTMLVGPR